MVDDFSKLKQDIDVPWDDVRAARVQKKALEAFGAARKEEARDEEEQLDQLEAKLEKPRRRWPVVSLAAAVLVAAAVMLVWFRSPTTETATAWAVASLDYEDGSRSLLSEQAQIQVVRDTKEKVQVRQRAGKVRYEITPRPERRFVIGAHDVVITVLGTVFDVDVEQGAVSVVVERGRVQVDHGEGSVILTAGQRVKLATSGDTSRVAMDDAAPEAKPDPAVDTDDTGPEPEAIETEPVVVGGGAPAGPSAQELLRHADAARASGDLATAVSKLQTLIKRYPRDARVTVATFTLARIYREQGNHTAAAQSFEACGNALRGDAIAEAAVSWTDAGQSDRGRAAAQRYLATFPGGVHAERMRQLAGAE